MKVFVCLFAIVACVSGSALHHAPVVAVEAAPVVAHAAVLSTGSSQQSRSQDAAGNYAFSYNEQHSTGGSSRSEAGSPGVATGSYTLNVADGRARTVNYVADALGFRAAIATNEPGTAAQPAASTAIASPHLPPAPVAPIAVAAPVAVAAAPVAVAAPVHHAVAPVVHHAAPVAVAHHAPLAFAHHAPLVHAPVAVAAPVVHHAAVVPAVSHYATAINHGVVAHAPAVVAHHAPALVHHAAPALHGPLHY